MDGCKFNSAVNSLTFGNKKSVEDGKKPWMNDSASMTRRGKPKTSPVWRSGNFCLCIVPV
jgi:hypothetical protein